MRKIKGLIVSLLIICFAFNTVAFAQNEPQVSAKSAILMEKQSGRILYELNSQARMYPASMTKIVTAMVALDYFEPEVLITVGNEINTVSLDSSKAGHVRGETITVENLIRGLMIPSGNDSATVLAAAVAKKAENNTSLTYEECENIFSRLMNEKAEELGATDTHFSNPHGYHADDHYTTAHDMALFAAAAMDNEVIKKIAAEKRFSGNGAGESMANDNSIKTQDYNWKSHNLLITEGEYFYEYATGLKTGFTDEAGDCVAATAEKDGVELIAVVMNSEDPARWIDAKNLFEYGFNNYSLVTVQDISTPVATVNLQDHNRLLGDTLDVMIKEDVKSYLTEDEKNNIQIEISYNNEILGEAPKDSEETFFKAPIGMGDEVGTVKYILNGETLAERKLYAASEVEESTFLSSVKFFFKNLGDNIFTLNGLITIAVVIVVIIVIILIIRIIRRKKRRNRYRYKMPRY